MHQWNSLPYSISASRSGPSEICLNQTFHHSTFMLSFRSEDWGIFSANLQMCASESWFFWGNPYQLSFAGFATHGPLGRQDEYPIKVYRVCDAWFDSLKMESLNFNAFFPQWRSGHLQREFADVRIRELVFLGQPVSIFVFRGISRHTAHWGGKMNIQ